MRSTCRRARRAQGDPAGHPESLYVSGRELGDEYGYILERKYAQKFPGNLALPAQPALESLGGARHETETEMLQFGGEYAARAAGGRAEDLMKATGNAEWRRASSRRRAIFSPTWIFSPSRRSCWPISSPTRTASLRFLARHWARVSRSGGGGEHGRTWSSAMLVLPETPLATQDLRLAAALDPARPFHRAEAGLPWPRPDRISGSPRHSVPLEAYDTLAKVYALYATLQPTRRSPSSPSSSTGRS